MKTGARLKDVAEQTGFSINTVSLALSGSKRISSESKEKILSAAQNLKYIPNSLARGLVKKTSRTIGVVLRELASPILMEVIRKIEKKLHDDGYLMILMTSNDNLESQNEALDMLISYQADGILIYPVDENGQERLLEIRKNNIPIISLSSMGKGPYIDSVHMDRIYGTYIAIEHLIKMGHEKIGFLMGSTEGKNSKYEGYLKVLENYKIEFKPENIEKVYGHNFRAGYEAAERLMKRRKDLTAIFASTDSFAFGVEKWCMENALRIPEDIAIIGYDNVEAAAYAQIPLTSVSYKVEEETETAIKLMYQLIERETVSSEAPVSIGIKSSLVIRDSCGFNKKGYVK